MKSFRHYINIIEEVNSNNVSDSIGFDTNEILYHGTNISNLIEFDRKYLKTARHFYTTPDEETARYYGKYVYKLYGKQDPQLDLVNLGIHDIKVIKEIFNDIYEDYIDHVKDNDEDLLHFKNNLIEILKEEHPEWDDMDIQFEIEDDLRYKAKLKEVTISYLFDYIQSGNLYGANGYFQNTIIDEILSRGFNSVRIYDNSSTGSPISVVFDSPSDIKIIGKV